MIQIDIPMPECCAECPCSELDEIMDEFSCNIVAEIFRIGEEDARAKRHEKCPLKEVPDINVGKWISVKDRLPEGKGEYLTVYHPCHWDNVDYHVEQIDIDTWRGTTTWAKHKYHRVTHWMPLPEPPKGE